MANDIQPTYLRTYAHNVHGEVIAGSISDDAVFRRLVSGAEEARASGRPFWVLGGPPCQGFSTAGKQRSMEDPRNHLAWDYVKLLEKVKPDGFVFENVTGLLNMEGGAIFAAVKTAFSGVMKTIHASVLSAENHGVPQRRKRVFLVGHKHANVYWEPPASICAVGPSSSIFPELPPAVSVEEALSDLPSLAPGQDGSRLSYAGGPRTTYQALMRGLIPPAEYLRRIQSDLRYWDAAQA